MAPPLPFTVFALGEAQLHQLHSPIGKVRSCTLDEYVSCKCILLKIVPVFLQVFVMGEVAVELFQETPIAFLAVCTIKFALRGSMHSYASNYWLATVFAGAA